MSFYRMQRGWCDKSVFEREPYCRRAAWVWLIEHAAFAAHNGLERGQIRVSYRFLAKAWRWTVPKVQRWLAAAQEAEMIRYAADTGKSIITICNYSKYQLPIHAADTLPDTLPIQIRYAADTNYKEGKKEIKEEEDSVAIATATKSASVTDDPPPDPQKAFWDRARSALTAAGVPKVRVGPLIGRWRRDFGDTVVERALDAFAREVPSDPVSFMVGCLNRVKSEVNGHAKLTPANQRFRDGREATLRAVLERERAAETSH
jgi:hypothetical protein